MSKYIIIIAVIYSMVILLPTGSSAATDNIYTLDEITPAPTWEGTTGNRLQSSSTYGDESVVTFNLPWDFVFYGHTYSAGTPVILDTNGNIWFNSNISTSAHSFGLDTTAGRGPVIAAWNDDLSSAYYGGVFVQHKTDLPLGERVVIEWQTETQADEGFFVPNSFETILFKDGRIRIDYGAIKTLFGADGGSGISRGDGTYNDITTNVASAPTLADRSFFYTPMQKNLTVNFTGTGGGTVTINPPGIAINTNYTTQFFASTPLTLHPAADPVSIFSGWTSVGSCSGSGDCSMTLDTDTTVTAGFDRDTAHQVYAPGSTPPYFSTIQAAYNKIASDNGVNGTTIKVWATDYSEIVNCNQLIDVTLQGGYDSGYANQVGTTVIRGALKISQGKVIANGIAIR